MAAASGVAPRIIPTTASTASTAPVAPSAPTAPVAAPSAAAPFQSIVLQTNIGAGYSDGPLARLTRDQRDGNKAVNNALISMNLLDASFKDREDFPADSIKALYKFEVAAKDTMVEYANGPVEGNDAQPKAFIKASPRRSDNTRPEQPGSTLATMNSARRQGYVISQDGKTLVEAPTQTPPTTGPTPTPTPTPTPGNPAPAPAPGTPTTPAPTGAADGPDRHVFSDDPNVWDNWQGKEDLYTAVGVQPRDERARIAELDKQIATLQSRVPSDAKGKADNAKQVQELQAERQRLVDLNGTIPAHNFEGIMGGVQDWKDGEGVRGVGKIISGGIQTVPAAVEILSDGLSRIGAMGRDWARAERARMEATDGGLSAPASLGLYALEYTCDVVDFCFNVNDAKWYQWLLPTMWASGALWLAGRIAVAVGHLVGLIIESLFDGIQWIVDAIRGKKSDGETDAAKAKRLVDFEVKATEDEIARMQKMDKRSAAQNNYLKALSDLLNQRLALQEIYGMPDSSAKTAMLDSQKTSVEAWRKYADIQRSEAQQPQTDATRADADVKLPPAPTPAPTATAPTAPAAPTTAPAVTTNGPAAPATPTSPAPVSKPTQTVPAQRSAINPPPPTPVRA